MWEVGRREEEGKEREVRAVQTVHVMCIEL